MFAFILQSVLVKVNLESGAIQSHAVPFDVTPSKSVFCTASLSLAFVLISSTILIGVWLKFQSAFTWNIGNNMEHIINNTIPMLNNFLIII